MSVAMRRFAFIAGESSLLRWAAPTTAVAAVLELGLLRILTRTAIHIPGMDRLPFVYVPLAEAGRFAYYLTVVMVIFTLILQVNASSRLNTRTGLAAAGTVGAFLGVAIAQRLAAADEATLSIVTLGAVTMLTVVAGNGRAVRDRIPIALYGSAFVLLAFHTSFGGAGGDSLGLTGEAIGLAFAISSPLLLARGHRDARARWVGLLSAVVAFSALAANAATVNILLLWNFGLTGSLPLPLSAVAIGALMYTLTATWRSDRALLCALVLLTAAGFGFHSTYQSALALCGLAMLGLGSGGASGDRKPDVDGPGDEEHLHVRSLRRKRQFLRHSREARPRLTNRRRTVEYGLTLSREVPTRLSPPRLGRGPRGPIARTRSSTGSPWS